MSTRLADRAASVLQRRLDRRSFVARSAVVGSALAAAPSAYVLRPQSAYAAVCSCSGSTCQCGSLCCDGYTEFCCTITGQNRCPSGTLTGGWWKADGSSFCGGAARYYLDCNAQCGSCGCGSSGICGGSCSGTKCGCARGSCSNRKAGCTGFRYGQCHQNVACLGPIVCRVVTCIPPWQTDSSCGTASRTDNNTRSHHRPCLTGDPFGAFDAVTPVFGAVRVRGWAIDPSTTAPVRVHLYVDGEPVQAVTADDPRADIGSRYPGSGSNHGFTAELPVGPGSHQVCAYGIDVGEGTTRAFACNTFTMPTQPFGRIDAMEDAGGSIRVRGWAIDPNTTGPVRIHVYVDGAGVRAATADLERGDLASLGYGTAHGYDETVDVADGARSVCVYAINTGPGSNKLLGCSTITSTQTPYGVVELVEGGTLPGTVRVRGWAVDPSTTGPVRIHVYADGVGRLAADADQPRPDVAELYPALGPDHGFDVTASVPSGNRNICVYAINQGAGASNRNIGCRQVTVP